MNTNHFFNSLIFECLLQHFIDLTGLSSQHTFDIRLRNAAHGNRNVSREIGKIGRRFFNYIRTDRIDTHSVPTSHNSSY